MRLCSRARTASQLTKSSGKTGYGVNQRSNGRNCNDRSDMPLIVWNVRFRGVKQSSFCFLKCPPLGNRIVSMRPNPQH
jgi:hypothetical protein